MDDDIRFATQADAFLEKVLERLEREDPDEVDCDLAQGVLTIQFADGSKCVMNRQTAAHQIWLAHGATGWHFAPDAEGRWFNTKSRGELNDVLADILTTQLGRPFTL